MRSEERRVGKEPRKRGTIEFSFCQNILSQRSSPAYYVCDASSKKDMIAFINLRVLHVAGIAITPFILLLTTAILSGFPIAAAPARRYGISRERIAEMSLWMIALGFVGAILFK